MSLILAVAVTGTLLGSTAEPDATSAAPRAMAAQAIVQVGLFVYVTRVGRTGWVLADTPGPRWRGAMDACVGVGLGVLAAAAIVGVETAWHHLSAAGRSAASATVLPHTLAEVIGWAAVAVLVGVVEEVVYRGYLQRHLGAWLRSVPMGVVASAVLFGLAHLEQGPAFATRAAGYGLALGVLAAMRGRLFPGIVAHGLVDLLALLRWA